MFLFIYDKNYDYNNDFMVSLSSSIYLKSFGINSIILNEYFNNSKTPKLKLNSEELMQLNVLLYFSFIIFSGFTLSTIVKEKEKNIKHLLYLSGNNIYSYWLGFLVVDMIKYFILIIFNFGILFDFYGYLFHILPVFIFFCLTLNMFLYFFSFLINKEENAQKSYFILILLSLIAIPLILYMIIYTLVKELHLDKIVDKITDYFYKPYFITIAEITPMTSLIMALFRISYCYSYNNSSYYPKAYVLVITHCIYLIVEFFIWGYLLYLCEIGYLTKLWNQFLIDYCLYKEYEFSTEVPVNDGFIIQENIPNYNTSNNNTPLQRL